MSEPKRKMALTLPDEVEAEMTRLCKDRYPEKTRAEVMRHLIQLGLSQANGYNAEDTKPSGHENR